MRTLLQQETICYSKSESALEWVGPLLLTPHEVRRIPEGIPGVYLLHVVAPRLGGYATFYAGKSHDLRRRLVQHLGERTTKPRITAAQALDKAYWSAAPVLNTGLLPGLEAGLIRLLRPICNYQTPTAVPLVPNLPPLFLLPALCEETNDDC